MLTRGQVEYVALRLLRRFAFTDAFLLQFGRWLPYYRTNSNQQDPIAVAQQYMGKLSALSARPAMPARILEVGSGATNSVAYALQRMRIGGDSACLFAYEPFAPLDVSADAIWLDRLLKGAAPRVRRLTDLSELPDGCIDVVLSNSVLEHVRDQRSLMVDLARVLAQGGIALHVIDLRDHFFKYPYHFLTFKQNTWNRWLDPGDLPRWRLRDILRAHAEAGLCVEVLERTALLDHFAQIKAHVREEFSPDDPDTAITGAVIAARRAPERTARS